jgi:hypothetical protein
LQVGCGGTRKSLRLILLKFCVWGYLKNMMHVCKVNTSKKMLQDSRKTQTSEVGLYVPWPKKSECTSTLQMVTTVVKPVLNTLQCSSVPGTATKLQIYLNWGTVLGWGNRCLPQCLDQIWGPPLASLPMCTGGSFIGNNEADPSPVSIAKVRNEWHYVPSWHRQERNFCCTLQQPARQIQQF